MSPLPSLFVSHGAPTLTIEPSAARDFLAGLGPSLVRPKAILMISAHFNAPRPTLTASPRPETIHDFGGFPDELYRMQYPAPGAPDLAGKIVGDLKAAGFDAATEPTRGLDHGAWVPLMLLYPEADIPVLQLSISMNKTPHWHYELGKALRPLRDEGVLIVGSGGATHNLRAFFTGSYRLDSPPPPWVSDFAAWLAEQVEAGDHKAIISAIGTAPHGHENHPTMDHILPLFVALGAGGDGPGQRLHHSTTYGVLAMDTYAFAA
ncbi:MAG: class III extradiol ring-cleavage dioxygenase [Hyphomonas sp.]